MSSVRPFSQMLPDVHVINLFGLDYININATRKWDTTKGKLLNQTQKTFFKVKKTLSTAAQVTYQTVADNANYYLGDYLPASFPTTKAEEGKLIEKRKYQSTKALRIALCASIKKRYEEINDIKGLVDFILYVKEKGRKAQKDKKNPNVDSFFLKTAYALCSFIIHEVKAHPNSDLDKKYD